MRRMNVKNNIPKHSYRQIIIKSCKDLMRLIIFFCRRHMTVLGTPVLHQDVAAGRQCADVDPNDEGDFNFSAW